MEVVGILSLIFGIIGLLSSVWYIGILPCVVGIVLGIIGLTDFLSDKKFAMAGLLISILGVVISTYIFVSDVDSGKLIVLYNKGKLQNADAGEMSDASRQTNSGWNSDLSTANNANGVYQNQEESNVTEVSKREEKTEEAQKDTISTEKIKEEESQVKQDDNNQSGKVLYQDDNVVITYQGISENYFGYDFNLLVENKSNRTLTVQVNEMSINGFMVNMPACSIEVAPGKKALDGIGIWVDDAENIPANSVRTAETKFVIIDWDDYDFHYETQNIVIQ